MKSNRPISESSKGECKLSNTVAYKATKERLDSAIDLLKRAVAYNAIPPEPDWWREYFEVTSEHAFLGSGSYITVEEYEQLSDKERAFYEEVNKPGST